MHPICPGGDITQHARGAKDGLETFQEGSYCHRRQGQMGPADSRARSWKCSGILQIK